MRHVEPPRKCGRFREAADYPYGSLKYWGTPSFAARIACPNVDTAITLSIARFVRRVSTGTHIGRVGLVPRTCAHIRRGHVHPPFPLTHLECRLVQCLTARPLDDLIRTGHRQDLTTVV